jgi:NAD(P)-dependent dehydrogenase (short-subunit alcohol dehydrogenase family)
MASEAADPGLWVDAAPHYPDLAGKRAFVVGGGSGIGAGLVAGFARAGCTVGFVALRPGDGVAADVKARTGADVWHRSADIRDIGALETALSDFGAIDVLIVNAARDDRHSLADLSVARYDDLMAVNLRPHLFAAKSVAPGMASRGGGVILHLGSNSAMLGLSGYPAYVAAKGAIAALAKALARELGPSGIRVNALVPGWVLTERQLRDWADPQSVKACIADQSLKRSMTLADIVWPALFLASSAAAMLTGQSVVVDGGRA